MLWRKTETARLELACTIRAAVCTAPPLVLQDCEKSADLAARLDALNTHFTLFLYQNVCRSLFEKDKLLFAFVLASKLQADARTLSASDLRFLLTGGVAVGDAAHPNPDSTWISEAKWGEMCRLSALPGSTWHELAPHVRDNLAAWKSIYDSADPASAELPPPWQDALTPFQRLVLLRTLRMDKIVPAMTAYVAQTLGPECAPPLRIVQIGQ